MIYIDLHFNAVVVGDKVSWITSSQSFAIPGVIRRVSSNWNDLLST